jgi:arylsulfatase A-like enzyme
MMPNCSPTRAALLSGQYPSRSGNGVYVVDDLNRGDGTPPMIAPPQNEDVPAAQVTHAEALAAAGYVNAHFGKFHVGGHEGGTATLPLNQGFEMNFGGGSSGYTRSYFASGQKFGSDIGPELDLWAGNYTPAYLETILKGPPSNPLHQRAMSPNLPDLILSDDSSNHGANKHLTDSMGDAALAFLNDHRRGALQDHPFFMQFHFQAVHLPIQPRWDLLRKYAELPAGTYHSSAPYAALLEQSM